MREEIEVQRGEATCPRLHSNQQSHDLKPDLSDSRALDISKKDTNPTKYLF